MAGRLLIDTDVLIEYLKGRAEAVEYLEGLTSDLYLPAISVAELFAGVKGDEQEKSLGHLLQAFVVLPVTESTARLGGLYRRDYRPSQGTGFADALIAATAEEKGADLVTFNRRHFPMVSKITVPYDRSDMEAYPRPATPSARGRPRKDRLFSFGVAQAARHP